MLLRDREKEKDTVALLQQIFYDYGLLSQSLSLSQSQSAFEIENPDLPTQKPIAKKTKTDPDKKPEDANSFMY